MKIRPKDRGQSAEWMRVHRELKSACARKNRREALALARNEVDYAEEAIRQDRLLLSRAWENLADVLWLTPRTTRDQQAALSLLGRATALCEEVVGENHSRIALLLRKRAFFHADINEFDQTTLFLARALDITRIVRGDNHPETINAIVVLANFEEMENHYDKQLRLLTTALALAEQVHGPYHQRTADVVENLALYHFSHRNPALAETLYQRALAIYQKVYGPHCEKGLSTLATLAQLYRNQGRHADVIQILKKILALYESMRRVTGDYICFVVDLAREYVALERNADARKLYEATFGQSGQMRTKNRLGLALLWCHRASFDMVMGEYGKAEEEYRKALQIAARLPSPMRQLWGRARALFGLAALYEKTGREEKGKACRRQAAKITHRHYRMQCRQWRSEE